MSHCQFCIPECTRDIAMSHLVSHAYTDDHSSPLCFRWSARSNNPVTKDDAGSMLLVMQHLHCWSFATLKLPCSDVVSC